MVQPVKDEEKVVEIPAEFMPDIEKLTGDLRRLAEIIRKVTGDDQVAVRSVLNMVAEFSGTYIYFPVTVKGEKAYRDRQIRAEYDRGAKVPMLARRYNLSERWVWDILGRCDEPTN